jgi:hypothetical protein
VNNNETHDEDTDIEDLVNNLLANFNSSTTASLEAMSSMTATLEGLLALPSFTTKQADHVLNVVDQLINITGQITSEDDSLRTVTNRQDIRSR